MMKNELELDILTADECLGIKGGTSDFIITEDIVIF